jgi:hypothetical protein
MTRSERKVFAVITIVVLLVSAVGAVGAWAQIVENTAIAGKAQAEAGVRSLAAQDATAAASQFAAATDSFAATKRLLGPDWFAAAATAVPWVGRQYAAVRTLAEIGLDGSAAGTELSGLLQGASASSGATDTADRLGAILVRGRAKVEAAFTSLSDAQARAAHLSAVGLVGPLAKEVVSAQSTLRRLAPVLDRGRALLPVLSYLASGDRRVLVVSQDGAELRPTGGFMGSYGIIDIGPQGFKLEKYADIYTFPSQPGKGAAFHSGNQMIDFPSSARAILGVWHSLGQPPVDGVIVIDTVAVQDLLAAVGPVDVPGYGEPFTSANLLERLLYLVEVEKGNQPDRKNVLGDLAAKLITRVLEAGSGEMARSALALGNAADAKHVQMYFTDPDVRSSIETLGWSGRIAPPTGTTDMVAISNTMRIAGKVNFAMHKTIDYEVGLRQDRSAETTLVLSYANTGSYMPQLPSIFSDRLRVYRSLGAVFPSAAPGGGKTLTGVGFGFPLEERYFTLLRGQSCTETLTARIPDALRVDTVSAAASGGVADYRLHVVRQDDLEDIVTTVTVTAPPGWRVTGASARLTASGASVPVTVERDNVRMAVPLSGDLDLDVRLTSS